MASTVQNLKKRMQTQIDDGLHPGSRLYVSQNREVLVDLAVGQAAEGREMENDTVMLWMSAGKPVTAVAVMQQVERSELDLDAPVAEVIPKFAAKGKEGITLRHILTHTGGFRLGDKVDVPEWDQAVADICDVPIEPNWDIGQKAGYHIGGSWVILGEMVRRVDGRDFGRYLREEIFSPAHMGESSLGWGSQDAGQLSVMHLTEQGKCVPHPLWSDEARLRQLRPGSNLMGSATALGRFYECLLDDMGTLLQEKTIREMTLRHRAGMFDQTFRHVVDFGLGVILNSSQYGPETVPYGFGRYASKNSFGHGGNQSSIAFADPERDLVVVYITNGMPGEPPHQKRMRVMVEAVYEELGLD